jgi:short-subunit dehydrogenase
MNICLISRTLSKLQEVESQIKNINPKVKTRIVQADFFANTSIDYFKRIRKQVEDLDIGIVVVCAGFKRADWFLKIPVESL